MHVWYYIVWVFVAKLTEWLTDGCDNTRPRNLESALEQLRAMCTIFFPLLKFQTTSWAFQVVFNFAAKSNGCWALKLRLQYISIQAVLLSAFMSIQDLYSIHNLYKISAQNRTPVPWICNSYGEFINTLPTVDYFFVCAVLAIYMSKWWYSSLSPFFQCQSTCIPQQAPICNVVSMHLPSISRAQGFLLYSLT